MAPPGGKRRLLVDDEALLDLFDRLAEDDDARRKAFRWVLGLILVRKKLLRLEGTAPTEEGTLFMLRRRGSDPELPPIQMLDPELSEDDAASQEENDRCYWSLLHHLDNEDDCWEC